MKPEFEEETIKQNFEKTIIDRIRDYARPVEGMSGDWTSLLSYIGEASFVLLGEASHGTQEFYRARAEITRRLIEEKGFNLVAVEADWPDAYRVNRFVQGFGGTGVANVEDAFRDFRDFPSWMWRNREVLDFVAWLEGHNTSLPFGSRVGFYGLDLYSLYASIDAVIQTLEGIDPEAAQRARYRYSCLEHFGEDPQAYGYSAGFNLDEKCERQVLEQLVELSRSSYASIQKAGFIPSEDLFFAEQNARVARNAEQYYRLMFQSNVGSWNLRDSHMAETIERLHTFSQSQGKIPKIVVWEHNSHVGDARATEMSRRGEHNLGQLVRQRWGQESVLVGFTTHSGTVTAASEWGGPAETKTVSPALEGSFEWLFHYTEMPRFSLILNGMEAELADLRAEKLERAIGVIYRPETERTSHYFLSRLMDQFDAVVHYDVTQAVEPIA